MATVSETIRGVIEGEGLEVADLYSSNVTDGKHWRLLLNNDEFKVRPPMRMLLNDKVRQALDSEGYVVFNNKVEIKAYTRDEVVNNYAAFSYYIED